MVRRLTRVMCLMTGIAAVALSAPHAAIAAGSDAASPLQPTVEVRREVERRAVELTTDTAIALESGAPFTELSIANPAIADISTISANSLYLLGKKPGRTTLMLMGEGGQVMSIIDVQVTPDISEFRARLVEILPGEEIEAFTANDGIVLTGQVSGQAQIERALALAGHYAPGRISNLMTIAATLIATPEVPEPVAVAPDIEAVERHIAEILPLEGIRVHVLGDTLVLSGQATSSDAVERALKVATLAAGGARISNLITVEASPDCTVRTRRGGEMIETTIPCRDQVSSTGSNGPAAGSAAPETTVALQSAEVGDLPRPKPRPQRLAIN
jgi:Flp pilus assembly secretin CpaC